MLPMELSMLSASLLFTLQMINLIFKPIIKYFGKMLSLLPYIVSPI